MNVCVIILAAGSGTRFGSKKQFIEFKEKPLWKYLRDKVSNLVDATNIVVVGVDIPGGITRTESVKCGIEYLENKHCDYDKVIILEAARPLVTIGQMQKIIEDNHLSSTYVLPLVNTVIKKDGTYLNRNDYYTMSTPTALNFKLFAAALSTGKYIDLTDDTRVLYEEYGVKPYFLEGEENLLKITYKTDVSILELLADKYEE